MSSPIEFPFIFCGACNERVTIDNFPLQSSTCGDSICKQCFDTKICIGTATDTGRDCLICKQPGAFHPARPLPNYAAMAAIDVVKDSAIIMQDAIQRALATKSADEARMPTAISTSHRLSKMRAVEDDGVDPEEEASPQVSNAVSHDHRDSPSKGSVSSAESESYATVDPVSPPIKFQGERMVWIKFKNINQLAHLLQIKGDVATIRWESGKYVEEVSVDRIEELDGDNSSSRRSRRVSSEKPGFRYVPGPEAKKTEKRRKISH
jgi:hypothetical protein